MDATIIHAPTSTKNSSGSRDPEMRSTKKGNQWYFGMKAHIGVDDSSPIVHSVHTTAANEHDVTQAHHLCSMGSRNVSLRMLAIKALRSDRNMRVVIPRGT